MVVWVGRVLDKQTMINKRIDDAVAAIQTTGYELMHHFGPILFTIREAQKAKFRRLERIIRNESVACGLNGPDGEFDPCLY